MIKELQAISIKNLTKRYGSKEVLKNINLTGSENLAYFA